MGASFGAAFAALFPDSVKAIVGAMGSRAGLHLVHLLASSVLVTIVFAIPLDGVGTVPLLWVGGLLVVQWMIPWVAYAYRDYKRPLLTTSKVRNTARPIPRILKEARPRDEKGYPDVILVCKAGTSWKEAFESNRAPDNSEFLLVNRKITIGILFTEPDPDSPVDLSLMTLSEKPTDHADMTRTREQCIAHAHAFMDRYGLAGRVVLRRIPFALMDAMSLYDLGDRACVAVDIAKEYMDHPYPVVVFEDRGEQRGHFAAVKKRILALWSKGTDIPRADAEGYATKYGIPLPPPPAAAGAAH